MPAKKEYKVEIRRRDKIVTYPKLMQPASTIVVDFLSDDIGPGVEYVLLSDVGDEDPDEYWKQIQAREGDLWEKYLKAESAILHKRIESESLQKPERLTV